MNVKQFIRFIAVGVFTTMVYYAVFYTLYKFLGLYYLLSFLVAFLSGVLSGYGLNKSWTFGVRDRRGNLLVRYLAVYGFSLVLGFLLMRFLVEALGVIPEIASLLIVGVTTCTNFIGTKFLVFRR